MGRSLLFVIDFVAFVKGKSKKSVDVLSPRIFTKGAKNHEYESPLQLLYKWECSALVLGPVRLVRPVGKS